MLRPTNLRSTQTVWKQAGSTGGVENYQDDVGLPRDAASGGRNNTLAIARDNPLGYFTHGTIISVAPFAHCYHVALRGETGLTPCVALSPTSLDVMSTRWATTLTPTTSVFVYRPLWTDMGIIVGVMPPSNLDSSLQLPDFFVPMSNSGFFMDDAFTIAAQQLGTGIRNCSAGRPGDILPGDLAAMNELGVGLMVGRLLATMKASDIARLDFFYLDNLVRLFSANFEHFASGYERSIKDDEGEISEIETLTPYPWEFMGVSSPSAASLAAKDYKWVKGQNDAPVEPVDPAQIGFWRLMRLRGYLGDLERLYVAAPNPQQLPVNKLAGDVEKPPADVGLFEQVIGADGSFTLRSARHITLAKTCLIPIPKRRREEHDAAGDSPYSETEPYKSSGIFGAGESHSKPEFPWADSSPSSRGAQLWDFMAYTANWYHVVPLARHQKDWYLPQSKDVQIGSISGEDRDPPSAPLINGAFEAPLPTGTSVPIDHRGSVTVFKSSASINMLDDGSIVLEDGYGSQIKLSGGNIYLTCPGDIWFQPGRSLIQWAPKDIISRAGNAVDISAAKGDIRVKAERNLHALAGNSGIGGVLLESKADGTAYNFETTGESVVSSGIMLKSKAAPIWAVGSDVYLRSKPGSTITLDAGEDGTLMTFSNTVLIAAQQSLTIANGTNARTDTEAEAAHTFSQHNVLLQAPLAVTGRTFVDGALTVNGGMLANGPVAGTSSPYVLNIDREVFQDRVNTFEAQIDAYEESMNRTLKRIKTLFFEDKTKIGNDDFIDSVAFSFRSDAQYGTSNIKIWEAPWQQLYRRLDAGVLWDEPAVKHNDEETYPHPGVEAWAESDKFGTLEFSFYNTESRRPEDRPYDVSQAEEPLFKTMKTSYFVTSQS